MISTGTLTYTRHHVDGDSPTEWHPLVEALNANAFRGRMFGVSDDTIRAGWTAHDDPLRLEIGTEAWRAPWLLFGLRVDTHRIPTPILRALVNRAARGRLEASGLERLPPGEMSEIREQVRDEYLPQYPTTPRHVPVAWNLETGDVLVFATARTLLDQVRKQFSATFSRALVSVDPVRAAAGGDVGRLEQMTLLSATELREATC